MESGNQRSVTNALAVQPAHGCPLQCRSLHRIVPVSGHFATFSSTPLIRGRTTGQQGLLFAWSFWRILRPRCRQRKEHCQPPARKKGTVVMLHLMITTEKRLKKALNSTTSCENKPVQPNENIEQSQKESALQRNQEKNHTYLGYESLYL